MKLDAAFPAVPAGLYAVGEKRVLLIRSAAPGGRE